MEMDDFTVLMKALSDPNRLRCLLALQNRELCVCQLIELLQLAPSTVSKHMSILKQAKLVQSRKDGRWIYYVIVEGSSGMVKNLLMLVMSELSDSETIVNDSKVVEQIVESDINDLCRRQRGESCCT